jgi:tryptophan synthase alpha chain
MNRINLLFNSGKKHLLSVYFTAGFPDINSTVTAIKTLEKCGVSMVEIGIPFSDSLADGPVIQKCNDAALKNGMSLKLLFQQLSDIRKEVDIPLIMMGSINPVLQYGIERFCLQCKNIGIDGVILPDLPFDFYIEEYQELFDQNNLHMIFLISPQTSDKRIRLIDEASKGFIYMVSASSTTGMKKGFTTAQIDYFGRIKSMNLKNPRMIGFGISSRETFLQACEYSDGAIIGSAFIKALEGKGTLEDRITTFCRNFIS